MYKYHIDRTSVEKSRHGPAPLLLVLGVLARSKSRAVDSQNATVVVREQEPGVEIDLGLIDKRRQKCLTEASVIQ
jgi:hypothetical protein